MISESNKFELGTNVWHPVDISFHLPVFSAEGDLLQVGSGRKSRNRNCSKDYTIC